MQHLEGTFKNSSRWTTHMGSSITQSVLTQPILPPRHIQHLKMLGTLRKVNG